MTSTMRDVAICGLVGVVLGPFWLALAAVAVTLVRVQQAVCGE